MHDSRVTPAYLWVLTRIVLVRRNFKVEVHFVIQCVPLTIRGSIEVHRRIIHQEFGVLMASSVSVTPVTSLDPLLYGRKKKNNIGVPNQLVDEL